MLVPSRNGEKERRMTNYKTIKETKEEMRKHAQANLERIKIAYETMHKIANGVDPETEIPSEPTYQADYSGKINFGGLIDHVDNALQITWELRADINTLRGQGQTK